jgi:hypothetical protein
MVPRHHNLGTWKRVQEGARPSKLAATGSLCEVARDHDHMRLERLDERGERL